MKNEWAFDEKNRIWVPDKTKALYENWAFNKNVELLGIWEILFYALKNMSIFGVWKKTIFFSELLMKKVDVLDALKILNSSMKNIELLGSWKNLSFW